MSALRFNVVYEDVKKRELQRHLTAHGCTLARQAAKHEMWENPASEGGRHV